MRYLSILLTIALSLVCQVDKGYPNDQVGTPPYEELLIFSTNGDFFVSGETIHLPFYCLNKADFSLSNISSIAYITVLNEDKEQIHQAKIDLKSGQGAYEFFIKSSYPTGNYYITAHTQLMRNQSFSDWYIKEVSIVNPFVSYDNPDTDSVESETKVRATNTAVPLEIEMTSNTFKQRSSIKFSLQSVSSSSLFSSLMVYREDDLSDLDNDFSNFLAKKRVQISHAPKQEHPSYYRHFPETKGELLSGTITGADTIEYPAEIHAMFPGKDFHFIGTELYHPDDTFNISIPKGILSDKVSIVSPNCPKCQIKLFGKFPDSYDFVPTSRLTLNDDQLSKIKERSIHSQIVNAYNSSRQNKDEFIPYEPFYGKADKVYILSDYASFGKMADIFKEITTNISLRTNGSENKLRLIGEKREIIEDPLILVNGIIVDDIASIIKMETNTLEKIETVSKRFYMGPAYFNGIISFTLSESGNNLIPNDHTHDFLRLSPRIEERLVIKSQRTPLHDQVLYWLPDLRFSSNEGKEFNIQAGDIPGTYIIQMEVLDEYGNIQSVSSNFVIE